jgi:signal transduction histidine kinase
MILLEATAADDGGVCISVSDTGQGIAPKDLPHVFERYWRGERSGRGRGTGLGLFIAYGIVKAHLGTLWVESELDRGTTFHLTLPAVSGPTVAKPRTLVPAAPEIESSKAS